jgi:hypothetical protein
VEERVKKEGDRGSKYFICMYENRTMKRGRRRDKSE